MLNVMALLAKLGSQRVSVLGGAPSSIATIGAIATLEIGVASPRTRGGERERVLLGKDEAAVLLSVFLCALLLGAPFAVPSGPPTMPPTRRRAVRSVVERPMAVSMVVVRVARVAAECDTGLRCVQLQLRRRTS